MTEIAAVCLTRSYFFLLLEVRLGQWSVRT